MLIGIGVWLPFSIDMGFKWRVQSSRKFFRRFSENDGWRRLLLSTISFNIFVSPNYREGKKRNTEKESLGFEPPRGTKHKSGVGRAIMTHYLVCLRTWTPTPCGLVLNISPPIQIIFPETNTCKKKEKEKEKLEHGVLRHLISMLTCKTSI